MTCADKSKRVRELNDALRRTPLGGHIMMTRGVEELGRELVGQLITLVRAYDHFNEDNDPYGEHEFGAFDHAGTKFFWKIDYYDPSLSFHSEDASDPSRTVRVLTLMRADEY